MIKKPATEASAKTEEIAQPIVDPVNESQIPLVSMILGIFSIVASFIPFLGIAAFILGLIGLKKHPHTNRGFSITGIATGAVSTVLSILLAVFLVFILVAAIASDNGSYSDPHYDSNQSDHYEERGMRDDTFNSI